MTHKFGTLAIHAGQTPDPSTGAVITPIFATSTYVQESPGVHKGLDYGRSHNPTRWAYERCVAALEGGTDGFAFSSGMAATATVLELLDSGSHVVALDDLYGGTRRLFERVRRRSAGLRFTYIPFTDAGELRQALEPGTRMIWVESPSNPLLKLVDLEAAAAIGRERGILTVADNTFASPWVQRPLEIGFDLVVHSATKYLNGHSDVIGGVCVTRSKALAEQLAFLQNAIGSVPSPFDAFLITRGLKTLAVRMERHCSNAMIIAQRLAAHPRVESVIYPGLESHPQHELAKRQMRGFRRDGLDAAQGCATRDPALSRALRALCPGREPGRRREPDRAPGDHDPRLAAGRGARRPGDFGQPGAAVGRDRGRGRSRCRSGAGARGGVTASRAS